MAKVKGQTSKLLIILSQNKNISLLYTRAMVSANQLTFNEPKRLPALDYLVDEFDITFATNHQCFRKKLNNSNLLLRELTYSLVDLTSDYYQLDFLDFK